VMQKIRDNLDAGSYEGFYQKYRNNQDKQKKCHYIIATIILTCNNNIK